MHPKGRNEVEDGLPLQVRGFDHHFRAESAGA